jgi:hypothetical protein
MTDQGKLFIGGISWETTTEKLIEYYKQFGEVTDGIIMKDKMTGRPRGFGFITCGPSSFIEFNLEFESLGTATQTLPSVLPRRSIHLTGEQSTRNSL